MAAQAAEPADGGRGLGMLYDTLETDRVVDAEAALEFMKEATKLATATELEDIGARLAAKSERIGALLAAGRIDALDEAGFRELTGWMFSLRRQGDRLLRANGIERLRSELAALLHGGGGPAARLDRFLGRVGGVERAKIRALASEALHFTFPERFWLWTSWIWNPEAGTGALALVTVGNPARKSVELPGRDLGGVTHAAAELRAEVRSDGELYHRLGRALLLLDREGHAAGYSRSGHGLFGTDVFLACVYAVYMYTVFRLKLSREFNRILPELPELALRVLGVKDLGGPHGR